MTDTPKRRSASELEQTAAAKLQTKIIVSAGLCCLFEVVGNISMIVFISNISMIVTLSSFQDLCQAKVFSLTNNVLFWVKPIVNMTTIKWYMIKYY